MQRHGLLFRRPDAKAAAVFLENRVDGKFVGAVWFVVYHVFDGGMTDRGCGEAAGIHSSRRTMSASSPFRSMEFSTGQCSISRRISSTTVPLNRRLDGSK